MRILVFLFGLVAGTASAAIPFKNGTSFTLKDVPGELVVERRAGEPVRFVLEENGTTGYLWAAEWNTNECEVALDHRGAAEKNERGERLCGAAGTMDVAVTSKIYTPARIEFSYRRPWEKGVKPIHALKLIVYTVGEAKSPIYPTNAVNRPRRTSLAGWRPSLGSTCSHPTFGQNKWCDEFVRLNLSIA